MDFKALLLNWADGLGNFVLENAIPALLLLLVGMVVVRIVVRLVSVTLEKSKLEKAAHTLIKSVIKVFLYLLLALIVASNIGIDVSGIVALTSVLTLAVSLSVQDALTNVIGGFTLLTTRPFSSGDFVEIASQSGTVQEIGLTYTKLITPDNKVISIPNSSVISADIINYTNIGTRRIDINVSASYDSPVEKVIAALKEAGNITTVHNDPAPFAALSSYGDSAINYVLRVWCDSENYWNATYEINKRIKEIFDRDSIEMTYPHLNVHLDK